MEPVIGAHAEAEDRRKFHFVCFLLRSVIFKCELLTLKMALYVKGPLLQTSGI